jgi:hypothetical protein
MVIWYKKHTISNTLSSCHGKDVTHRSLIKWVERSNQWAILSLILRTFSNESFSVSLLKQNAFSYQWCWMSVKNILSKDQGEAHYRILWKTVHTTITHTLIEKYMNWYKGCVCACVSVCSCLCVFILITRKYKKYNVHYKKFERLSLSFLLLINKFSIIFPLLSISELQMAICTYKNILYKTKAKLKI